MRRAAAVDTLAAVVFFTVIAAATEYLVAGLSPGQVLVSRTARFPVLVLTGRPWRDMILTRTGALRGGRAAMLVVDTAAFLSFQVPLYGAILLIAGASGTQMAAALTAATIAMLLLSRPVGVFLDWMRRRAGVAPGMTL